MPLRPRDVGTLWLRRNPRSWGLLGRFFALALAQRRFVSKLATSHGGSERCRASLFPGYVFDRRPAKIVEFQSAVFEELNQLVVCTRIAPAGVVRHIWDRIRGTRESANTTHPVESWRTPQKDGKKATAIERLIFRRFCLSQFREALEPSQR